MTPFCKARIKKTRALMKKMSDGESILIISSSPYKSKSNDTEYEYRPDSNLFYLTNSAGKEMTLVISTKSTTPILIAPPIDPKQIIWQGKQVDYKKVAKGIGAELRIVDGNQFNSTYELLKNHDVYYHQNTPNTLSWELAKDLQEMPFFRRSQLPATFVHCDRLLQELRLYKDKYEISCIKRAAEITNNALLETIPFITPLAYECDISNTIDYLFKIQGGHPAFNTIVATGPSAATLHHEDLTRKLKGGDLLLIDCGASYNMYAADITRTIPVSGSFNPLQRELYSIVLDSQYAAIKTVKNGVSIKKIHTAAAKVITEGLKEVGVLKGKVSHLMSKEAYKPYFMHGIGHTLGLDVHDLGNLRDRGEGILREGMVITIEPGIYFQNKIKHIPPSGIRIEDDVLVKRSGSEILSSGFPKEISEIEELLNL